jgi:hypothetical protein
MEELFERIALPVAVVAEAGAALIIGFRIIQAGVALLKYAFAGEHRPGDRKRIWLDLISPRWMDIGQLAAIAAVRTFLNYFLEKDLGKYAASEPNPA